jgi:hypothetical protein
MPPVLLALAVFQIGSHVFAQGQPQIDSTTYSLHTAGTTGVHDT